MSSTKEQNFSKSLEQKTNDLIQKHFAFTLNDTTKLYHFTKKENADKIVGTQIFWASFIRSTSDSLEFALPLSHCRDWLCFANRLFDFSASGFPAKLFSHFNEQAIDPVVRYYFVSLTEDKESSHHLLCYGDTPVKFEFGALAADLGDFLMILKCIYSPDLKQTIFDLLDEWKVMFLSLLHSHDLQADGISQQSWFYMFMRFCHMCSLCLKQSAFTNEKEVRLIFVPKDKNYDSKQQFSEPRGTLKISNNSLLLREYLPLKLSAMGITTSFLS